MRQDGFSWSCYGERKFESREHGYGNEQEEEEDRRRSVRTRLGVRYGDSGRSCLVQDTGGRPRTSRDKGGRESNHSYVETKRFPFHRVIEFWPTAGRRTVRPDEPKPVGRRDVCGNGENDKNGVNDQRVPDGQGRALRIRTRVTSSTVARNRHKRKTIDKL